jgi:tetratricopeptide (TPR) repeat protein
MPRISRIMAVTILVTICFCGVLVKAQTYHRGGAEFDARRPISLPVDKKHAIVVAEFYHHGEIDPDGRNVLVAAANRDPVPTKILQLGPGDFCRIAFQTVDHQRDYEILYGGDPPDATKVPPWNDNSGLILETREFRQCNLNSLESVRQAFNSSVTIGRDYVSNVQHSHNPFSLKREPFLSRYSGTLHISKKGQYGFLSSSQDCSFLLIDDKVVVDAPGRHGPMRRARRGSRKDIQLSAGAHKFEYYHAASGPATMMVAAWEVSPRDAKPVPVAIPPEAFRTQVVGRIQPGSVETRVKKLVPDFLVEISGEVPLPDNDLHLIGVQMKNVSGPRMLANSKYVWDFGDGQTSDLANPQHVYLRPGLYTVKLSIRRGVVSHEMANRVFIDQPKILKRADLHTLDQYLPILDTYDPSVLDAVSLKQLVAAYLWKADTILTPTVEETKAANKKKGDSEEDRKPDGKRQQSARRDQAFEYLLRAVDVGKVPLLGDSVAKGDEELHALAALIAPLARCELGDSRLAGQIWYGASLKIGREELKGRCELEAADIMLNDVMSDMSEAKKAKVILDAATARFGPGQQGPVASRLQRVWGDYHAITGDGKAARKAYNRAEEILGSTRSQIERIAWRGARSRSAEHFIRDGRLERAARELRQWQEDFPAEKIDGYLSLLFARYWVGREMYAQAIALADQLLIVNADSPYMDQLLLLGADCEVKRKNPDRALAMLHSLLRDYPGSPLVPAVREQITRLEASEK